MALLEVNHLGIVFGGLHAVDKFSLKIEKGQLYGLIGPNGAGKTTTIRAALGLIKLDAGEVHLLGQRCDTYAPDETQRHLRSRIGLVLDTCPFPSTLKVGEVERLVGPAYPTWSCETFAGFIDRFGLDPKTKVKDLSRGMGMKLTLAFALSHNPELLVLDEATAGLDPIARDEVLDLLRDFMAEGDRGILMSTHITSDLEKIADEVVCVDAGRIVFTAPKDVITDEAGVARCRAADVTAILDAGFFAPGEARILRHDYGCDVLVPDRFAFARAFPDIPVDKATIEDYMTLTLKGESR